MKRSRHLRLIPALAALLLAAPLAASAASDTDFLKKAMQGDNSEMKLGKIAAERGASPGVRSFGRTLEADHAKAKQEALPVARRHGLKPTDAMAPEARKEQGKLSALSGAAFDREFARYMVEDHKKDISDFERQVRHGDPSTARLARQTLPALRKHLRMAQALAR